MRNTIARTLAIGALLAIPFAGATAANAATVKVTGNWTLDQRADDPYPTNDRLTINKDGSFRLGGEDGNRYDCYGLVDSAGTGKYVFRMHCTTGDTTAKAEYKGKSLIVHFSADESFHR
ncbi:hypothetical protein [Fodinicola acaciae]|uniref:hypothetical protein n=1 Tax=Fodinicola acaciae TaxID=2681555 RepID=UPI0013D33354|nr:hypothetical protein [Fodinicola acaciae]